MGRSRPNYAGMRDHIYREWKRKKKDEGITVPSIKEMRFTILDREQLDQIVLEYIIRTRGGPKGMFIFAGASDKDRYVAMGLPIEEALKYVKPENIPKGAAADGDASDEEGAAGQVGPPAKDGTGPGPDLPGKKEPPVHARKRSLKWGEDPAKKSLSPGRGIRKVPREEEKTAPRKTK